jgi:predicted nucleic acid-binding protein
VERAPDRVGQGELRLMANPHPRLEARLWLHHGRRHTHENSDLPTLSLSDYRIYQHSRLARFGERHRRSAQLASVLDSITLTQMTTTLFEEAARLGPAILRSLDALHLAAALDLGDDLEGLITYDDRLAEAAQFNGIRVTAPR